MPRQLVSGQSLGIVLFDIKTKTPYVGRGSRETMNVFKEGPETRPVPDSRGRHKRFETTKARRRHNPVNS